MEDLAKGIAGLSTKLKWSGFHLSNVGIAIKDLAQTLSILRGRNADRVILSQVRWWKILQITVLRMTLLALKLKLSCATGSLKH